MYLNAGVGSCPFQRTVEGFEMQSGTNHIGHALFVKSVAALTTNCGHH